MQGFFIDSCIYIRIETQKPCIFLTFAKMHDFKYCIGVDEGKLEKKLRRKINALCIDYRFYTKKKKQGIISPCLAEYEEQVNCGISSETAFNDVYKNCKYTLERKYEKRNKFLFLMLFSIVLFLTISIVESYSFDELDYSVNILIYWQLVVAIIFIGVIVFLGLTHSGRFRTYLFISICVGIYFFTFFELLYLTNISSSVDCFQDQRIVFTNFDTIEVRTFHNTLTSTGSCRPNSSGSIYDTGPYINMYGTLFLSLITIICYIFNHCLINSDYPRINIYNLCTQYGVCERSDKNEIKDRALAKYYSLIDSGESRKDAKKNVMEELDKEFSLTAKKKNKYMFSLVTICIYVVIAFGLSSLYEIGGNHLSAFLTIFLQLIIFFAICIIFIIMLFFYNHLYWYDFVFVALAIVILFAASVSKARLLPPDIEPSLYDVRYFSYYPFATIKEMDSFIQVLNDEGVYEYVYDRTSDSIYLYWENIYAIISIVIIIPLFIVNHFKIKKSTNK